MDDIAQLKDLSRSERAEKVFGFEPTDYQAELLDYHEGQSKTQAAPQKGRQVGATLTGSVIAADYALTHADETTLITAPTQEAAQDLFREFKRHFERSEFSLEEFGITDFKKTQVEFATGHRAIARTLGNGELSQRGKNPSLVVVDEAQDASTYHLSEVVEPFFITHKEYEYYLLGTPKGMSGYFYHAVEGDESDAWFSPYWPTEISPFADEDYLEKKRKEKDSTTFAHEYEGKFADTGEVWIPYDLFTSCVFDDVDYQNELVYLFVDVARKGKDRTVYLMLGESGIVYDIWAEQESTVPGVIGRIKNLHKDHNFEAVGVDENAVGGGVVDDKGLKDLVIGVKFTVQSKHEMYTDLKADFENENVTIPADIDYYNKLEQETTSLEFEFTQGNGYLKVSHPPNGHDDFADALAGANYIRNGKVGKTKLTRRKARSNSFTSA